jgi:hypothetical protein
MRGYFARKSSRKEAAKKLMLGYTCKHLLTMESTAQQYTYGGVEQNILSRKHCPYNPSKNSILVSLHCSLERICDMGR